MSEWIKVTPETMPPDMKEVFVTAKHFSGQKSVAADIRWNPDFNSWEYLSEAGHDDYWEKLSENFTVTHWQPYPAPAED